MITSAAPTPKDTPARRLNGPETDEKQANVLRSIPTRLQSVVRRSYAGNSLRAAINAKCFECYGYENVRGIQGCTATECPLHASRPHRKSGGRA